MFRLPDEEALNAMLARTNCRVVSPISKNTPREKPVQGEKANEAGPAPHLDDKPSPKPKARAPSKIEFMMGVQIREIGLPEPARQFHYFEEWKYTADYAWPARRVALEVDGGVHTISRSFTASFRRAYLLLMAGWKVLHVGKDEVKNGQALEWITHVLALTTGTPEDDAKIKQALITIGETSDPQP